MSRASAKILEITSSKNSEHPFGKKDENYVYHWSPVREGIHVLIGISLNFVLQYIKPNLSYTCLFQFDLMLASSSLGYSPKISL